MNEMTPTSEQRAERLQGVGCKRKRVEDVRFVQGKGNYVDDLKLPGLLYGDFARSPHGHARIKRIDTSQAKAVPGVLAVLTAADLKPLSLHYMPTLAGDVQAVLAEDKVLYQNQEVAFVIAEDRYVAADAADLVEVEYEPLPVNVDPLKAMTDGAPVIREDLKDKTDGAHGKRRHPNHIFSWAAGDKAATDAAFAKADVTIRELIVYPRCHPCPLETCQCVASFDKIKGELTLWGTFQAPHVIRTVGSLISKIMVGTGVLGGAEQTGVLDQAQEAVGKVQAAKGVLDSIHDLATGLAPYWWVGVIVVGFITWRLYGDVIKRRLHDHQTGVHLG